MSADLWPELDEPADGVKRNGLKQPYVFTADFDMAKAHYERKTLKGRKGYTRTTTYIDCLDDKENLATWGKRLTLGGVVAEPSLLIDAREAIITNGGDLDAKPVKDALDLVVRKALEAAEYDKKSKLGTFIHGLCEDADALIKAGATPAAALTEITPRANGYENDVAAYLRRTIPILRPLMREQLTINDELQVAGTPDGVAEWAGPETTTPNGYIILPGDVLITDIKTGTLEYSVGKMAMQLGVYANSVPYEQDTNTRGAMPDRLRRDVGIIMHMPAGTATCDLYAIDIATGYNAVRELAGPVRQWRNDGKKLATLMEQPSFAQQVAGALSVEELRTLWAEAKDSTEQEACTARAEEMLVA